MSATLSPLPPIFLNIIAGQMCCDLYGTKYVRYLNQTNGRDKGWLIFSTQPFLESFAKDAALQIEKVH